MQRKVVRSDAFSSSYHVCDTSYDSSDFSCYRTQLYIPDMWWSLQTCDDLHLAQETATPLSLDVVIWYELVTPHARQTAEDKRYNCTSYLLYPIVIAGGAHLL